MESSIEILLWSLMATIDVLLISIAALMLKIVYEEFKNR